MDTLGTLNRGNSTEIGTYLDRFINSEVSGNLIDLCPVGALTSKPYALRVRPWDLISVEGLDFLDSIGSNLYFDVYDSEVFRVTPRINESINEEWISDRIRFSYDSQSRRRIKKFFVKEQPYEDMFSYSLEKRVLLNKRVFGKAYSRLLYFFYLCNLVKSSCLIGFSSNFFLLDKFINLYIFSVTFYEIKARISLLAAGLVNLLLHKLELTGLEQKKDLLSFNKKSSYRNHYKTVSFWRFYDLLFSRLSTKRNLVLVDDSFLDLKGVKLASMLNCFTNRIRFKSLSSSSVDSLLLGSIIDGSKA